MKILGIDPGIGKMGFGLIEAKNNAYNLLDYGCITTKPGLDIAERLVIIYNEIKEILKKEQPDVVAVEKLFFTRNVTTAMSVGEARGVVMLCAAIEKLKIVELTPLQVKQAITGYGRAEKGQMQRMVQSILKMEARPRPDDAADALAIAICAGSTNSNQ